MLETGARRRRKRNSNPFFERSGESGKRDGLNFRRRRKKPALSKIRPAVFLILQIILVVMLAYVFVSMFGIRQEVAGQSMEPTLAAGDEVLLNKLSYRISEPDAGNIIVFYPNGNESGNVSIKRIIAVPGNTIRIENGAVYVDDRLIEDVARTDYISDAGLAAEGVTLKAGEYFVLGDNRNNSEDSRYASIGNISKEMIIGRVWLALSPGGIRLIR